MGFYTGNGGLIGPGQISSAQGVFNLDVSFFYNNSFNVGTGTNGTTKVRVLSNGKLLIYGDFTSFNGVVRNRIARLNNNGSLDTLFNIGTGFNARVDAIAVQSDGKIIVGGEFTQYNGTTCERIIRLNTDGSVDTSFSNGVNSGFNETVTTLHLQPNGLAVFAGGTFTQYRGVGANRIVKLNTSNGSRDATFAATIGANDQVQAILVQPETTNVLIGGYFTTYNNSGSYRYLAKVDSSGVLDTNFTTATTDNGIHVISSVSSNQAIIAGRLTQYRSTSSIGCLTKINYSNGSRDFSFDNGAGFTGANGLIGNVVLDVRVQPNGRYLVGGSFTQYRGVARSFIARIGSTGTLDTSFDVGTGFTSIDSLGRVESIDLDAEGNVYVAGLFDTYNGVTVSNIVKLNSSGTLIV